LSFTQIYTVVLATILNMSKKEKAEVTPAPPSLKKQLSSTGSTKNGSILSFFSKAPNGTPKSSTGFLHSSSEAKGVNAMAKPSVPVKKPSFKKTTAKNITPVPSSDAMGPSSSQENENGGIPDEVENTGLPSPATPAKKVISQVVNGNAFGSSPSRKVCLLVHIWLRKKTGLTLQLQAKKAISYSESSDDDEDAFDPAGISAKNRKARKPVVANDEDEEDVFIGVLDGADDDG
jgi:DNA mismatch repair protein MSH6